ncbi:MAG: hypothetical protein A3G52_04170 [Candidatus Taylorbacteria bacterium RIFCSPLOWO2_12_FULL_43_20]|uniref:Alpha/beta hydrolase n=1 Tax=Candidatus Taylorbacteria bacterium RIFCSPLOWO2_12_FULL_43_20 TaxID=1802332 RepID=A0A1G2P2D9_9BACT|nr:MAG: hypothetical protein A2825_01305 [Candidatus Taylorbacteria bacterium RIFCSPHIGHO2_01_FULL_43_120]OHA22479.1 MAG: hypothetical protein A3B98_00815 [Candidatus Taylorbacteria bacterium RIFCSPHIGHO2_02_FULL_43_55]OHA28369.1 MAG: hypothetical protein A3E92_01605 [Candidatus Taylorbacteria bacterium RIFCSPHIGHO2_12_FULL_42_34]OHA30490.1 MAG: hypothetical protein A3B09_00570 [Candidatus Taylorbacteria bacterium RIFCSPLOWO2_01_FULL_43_83]OHA38074.1 MAG: hypothetical protein A3H58_01675 [Candi
MNKKVFIIHGLETSPNGGWRPWLMAELEKRDVYACALPMPEPDNPVCKEWIDEISRNVNRNTNDEIYLVGHSLGVPAVLRYLEKDPGGVMIRASVLVAGPYANTGNKKLDSFFEKEFDFEKIKSRCEHFAVIHGSNDPLVPPEDAKSLSKCLNAELTIIKNGGHLNGSAGIYSLPECLHVLEKTMHLFTG